MPLAEKFFGSHEEMRSVIAALRNRFGAVLPEKSKWRGLPKGEAWTSSDEYRSAGAMMNYRARIMIGKGCKC